MSTWQIGMTIIGTFYALAILYVVISTARSWGQIDLDRPMAKYCPEGTRCRLCGDARAEETRRERGPTIAASIGDPRG